MQSSGFYSRLLGPVSDYVLLNRANDERELYQVISYSLKTTYLLKRYLHLFSRNVAMGACLIVIKNLFVIPKCELPCSK